MAKTKTVTLVDGFDWHGENVKSLSLAEPTGAAVADLGEPRVLVRTVNGAYFVEQKHTIKQYIERCLKHEAGADAIGMMSMADYMILKDEISGFFTQAESRIAASRPTPSSSA